MTRVLIAEDDANFRKILLAALVDLGFDAAATDSGSRAVETLGAEEFDVLLLDLTLPDLSGMEVLKKMKADGVPAEVVIITGDAAVSTAVEAMKYGACDYVAKPFKMDELKIVIEKAHEKKKLLDENALLKTQIRRQSAAGELVTSSAIMHDILKTAMKVAASDFPVLVCGESGTGKELVSRAIHDASTRSDGPFIPINCGAIPASMIESELFGHEMGAFTGAHARKPGLLEIADRGVLFLDEIGDMPMPLQVKFLRVIETGKFYRIGGTREISVNVKFVAATNKDLKRLAEEGTFRQDLYYRISALTLLIPPLRERREDIPALVDYFIRRSSGFKGRTFGPEALAVLSGYSWPGNVRELQNVIHRTLLLSSRDVIGPEDLPPDLTADRKAACVRLEDIEREHILKVLSEAGGHRGRAAELLGIAPKTLYNKLASYEATA